VKNPCLSCDIHLTKKNKLFETECIECSRRVAYVRALGDMTHGMPDKYTDLLRDRRPLMNTPQAQIQPVGNSEGFTETPTVTVYPPFAEAEPQPEQAPAPLTRTCKTCGKTAPLDEFPRNSVCKYGREPHCKACHAAKRKLSGKKPAARTSEPRKTAAVVRAVTAVTAVAPVATPNVAPAMPNVAPQALIINVDFADHPQIHQQLMAIARDQMRTPAAQILWKLRMSLPADK
jgi:hypothetical protein